ncbi:MAG TPA: ABC transporter permease [Candidatus Bathyarchaeia archaeon]|nr:ABC transporter permease [Candidatus Bathyarchaeia archaeon]
MGLRTYLLKRALNTFILICFVITLNFVIFEQLPGQTGLIQNLIQNPKVHDPTVIERYELLFGICQSFVNGQCIPASAWSRFSKYFVNMLTFNLGVSYQSGRPIVYDMITTGRLQNTLLLLGTSTTVALIIGLFLGVLAAARRGRLFDTGWVTTSLITFSLPTFWMGLLAILIFSQNLGWFPSGGVTPGSWIQLKPPFLDQLLVRAQYLFLPASVLTLFFYGGNLLLTRATVVMELNADYITTARAKGLPERTVLFKHALKNASLPIVTNAALAFGGLLGGAIITETIFNWDGLGFWIINSINSKDLPVMQAMFYLIALTTIAANFISDIIYGVLDPRIKYE